MAADEPTHRDCPGCGKSSKILKDGKLFPHFHPSRKTGTREERLCSQVAA